MSNNVSDDDEDAATSEASLNIHMASDSEEGDLFTVEEIIDYRYNEELERDEFEVRWEGYHRTTWEPRENLLTERIRKDADEWKAKKVAREKEALSLTQLTDENDAPSSIEEEAVALTNFTDDDDDAYSTSDGNGAPLVPCPYGCRGFFSQQSNKLQEHMKLMHGRILQSASKVSKQRGRCEESDTDDEARGEEGKIQKTSRTCPICCAYTAKYSSNLLKHFQAKHDVYSLVEVFDKDGSVRLTASQLKELCDGKRMHCVENTSSKTVSREKQNDFNYATKHWTRCDGNFTDDESICSIKSKEMADTFFNHKGHRYSFEKVSTSGKTHWKCSRYSMIGCPARIYTRDGVVVKTLYEHNHVVEDYTNKRSAVETSRQKTRRACPICCDYTTACAERMLSHLQTKHAVYSLDAVFNADGNVRLTAHELQELRDELRLQCEKKKIVTTPCLRRSQEKQRFWNPLVRRSDSERNDEENQKENELEEVIDQQYLSTLNSPKKYLLSDSSFGQSYSSSSSSILPFTKDSSFQRKNKSFDTSSSSKRNASFSEYSFENSFSSSLSSISSSNRNASVAGKDNSFGISSSSSTSNRNASIPAKNNSYGQCSFPSSASKIKANVSSNPVCSVEVITLDGDGNRMIGKEIFEENKKNLEQDDDILEVHYFEKSNFSDRSIRDDRIDKSKKTSVSARSTGARSSSLNEQDRHKKKQHNKPKLTSDHAVTSSSKPTVKFCPSCRSAFRPISKAVRFCIQCSFDVVGYFEQIVGDGDDK